MSGRLRSDSEALSDRILAVLAAGAPAPMDTEHVLALAGGDYQTGIRLLNRAARARWIEKLPAGDEGGKSCLWRSWRYLAARCPHTPAPPIRFRGDTMTAVCRHCRMPIRQPHADQPRPGPWVRRWLW